MAYPIQISDEQLEMIWSRASEDDHRFGNIQRTTDENGDIFTIFNGWKEVETLAQLIYEVLPRQTIEDNAPSWLHLSEDRKPNPHHDIEWAIGEYGFDDQFSTCSQCCYSAIDIHDYMPMWGYNYDVGELYCRNCLKSNAGDSAQMYLQYCAAHLEDDGEILRSMIDPQQYGYILTNPRQAYGEWRFDDFLNKYEGVDNFPMDDHPDLPHTLSYAGHEEIQRLGKAARLIDPNLRIVAQYGTYSTYLLWSKFEDEVSDDGPTNLLILQYGISLVFTKYKLLSQSKGK